MSSFKYFTLTMTISLYNELIDHTKDYKEMENVDLSNHFL